MDKQLLQNIVWFVFVGIILFLSFFGIKAYNKRQKKLRQKQLELDEFRMKNEYLTSEKFDALQDNELEQAVIFSVSRKENEDEDYFNKLSLGEKIVYGIYLLNTSISRQTGINTFFNSPATIDYVDEIDSYFKEIGANEISNLLTSAKKFNDVLENGEEDNEDSGDYATYNFSDYTHEYVTLIAGTNFHEKLAEYIRSHKQDFIEKEIKDDEVA